MMIRTIYGKMLVIFISIIILSFSVAGVTLYYFMNDYGMTSTRNSLEDIADRINSRFINYTRSIQDNPLAESVFLGFIDFFSENSRSIIIVITRQGYVYHISNEYYSGVALRNFDRDKTGALKLPDERQYKKIMSGKEPEIIDKYDFFGLFKNTPRKDTPYRWLTIEKPLIVTDSGGKEQVLAAVILSSPIADINRTRTTVLRYFGISVAVSVFISILLVFVFSRRITKPLKEMNEAARVIAGGEFRNKLSVRSKDEIGELAQSFNQMITDLENLEQMRRNFIANVSHELRTPMTSIRGFIEGILDGTVPPEKHAYYLGIVRDESARLNKLVNDLLDLARMEAGEMKLTMRSFDINELIRRCIIKLEQFILGRNIDVEADFQDVEAIVHADCDAIERVVMNLIHNAVKFTPENGTIVVSTRVQRDKVIVSVKDYGIGIPQEDMEHIWDRFYKSDKSRSRDISGTGLGLSIVKNLIGEHGQEIWARSEPGKGSVFEFTLEKGQREQRDARPVEDSAEKQDGSESGEPHDSNL